MNRLAIAAIIALLPAVAIAQSAEITINDPKAAPESITMAPGGALIMGSAGLPFIFRAAQGATVAEKFIDVTNDGGGTFLGVLADAGSNTLWACQITAVPGTTQRRTFLRGFDLGSGAAKFRWALPGDANTCNDFTVGTDKALYITDTANGRIYRLKPGAADAELLIENRTLIGVDGITFLDGVLYVNTVTTNNLYRIPLDSSGKAGAPIDIWMDQPVSAPDGMRAAGGKMFMTENRVGKVDLVTIAGDKAHITVLKEGLGTPTAVEPVGDTLWIGERANNRAVAIPIPK